MSNKIELSVVVPTHNRSQYAISCIEAILSVDEPSIQLVVSDTSTDGRLWDLLHNGPMRYLDDPRFKYSKIEGPSSLTKNHNDAIMLSDGQYVVVIGDDDCITRAAIEATRWASRNGVPVVSQTIAATYAWPDFRSRLARKGHAGRLYVPRAPGVARWRDGQVDLAAALGRAFQAADGMPRCYHGIVKRDFLEEVRSRTGAYFHGSSPDMSGAVSLACLVERYCEVDIPLTIPGVSGGSNSGRSAMNTHKGELASETQTSGFQEQGWTTGVPRFFSVETVWAHAGLSSLERLSPDLSHSFNFPHLLALCHARHPEFKLAIEEATQELFDLLNLDVSGPVKDAIREEKWARLSYLVRRAMNPTAANGRRYFSNLGTIAAASTRYEAYAKANQFSFVAVISQLG